MVVRSLTAGAALLKAGAKLVEIAAALTSRYGLLTLADLGGDVRGAHAPPHPISYGLPGAAPKA